MPQSRPDASRPESNGYLYHGLLQLTGSSRGRSYDARVPSAGSWTATAPGRVNLIGEHTDYNGLPVLPIAIDRAVRIEFRVVGEPVVRLDSAGARFAPLTFQLKRPIEPAEQGDWSNYVRSAARGLLESGLRLERGIEGTVSGDVPIAAGLSSSSALVVASALALLRANGVGVGGAGAGAAGAGVGAAGADVARASAGWGEAGAGRTEVPRLELAALMARAERFVGLEGGGMDQAACLFGEAGHALRIEFEPLRVTKVAVPEGWRWVVASSLVRAEKSGGAREAYNERARQCREALGVVVEHLSRPGGDESRKGDERRGKLRDAGMSDWDGHDERRGKSRDAGMSDWDGHDERRGKSRDAGMSVRAEDAPTSYSDLVARGGLEVLIAGVRPLLSPVLLRRFRHVVTEGLRVAQAEDAMRAGEIGRFGELMVASHESLRSDYEVSTPALDEIVEIALGAGAAGARLTGAGFGGCAVALCDERTVRAVMDALAARFYAPRLGGPPGRDVMFAVRPSGGAGVGGVDAAS